MNDNFGRWRSDFKAIVRRAQRPESLGRQAAELLQPESKDYFVLKPAHSGFFASCLNVLLRALDIETHILCGIAGNIYVQYTANDAYMRGYRLIIPRDCVVSNTPEENEQALTQMRRYLKAATFLSGELVRGGIIQPADKQPVT